MFVRLVPANSCWYNGRMAARPSPPNRFRSETTYMIKPFLRYALLLMGIFLAAFCRAAVADDAAMSGEGGTMELMSPEHPSISMVSEVVRIDHLPYGHVHAHFVFQNTGPACTVQMGFPGSSGGDGPESPRLSHFRSWVDGQPVPVAFRNGPVDSDVAHSVTCWYIKSVHFGPNETRTVDDEYVDGGGSGANDERMYGYVLMTGASWHGPIEAGTIIVDAAGLRGLGRPTILPTHFVRHGETYTWHFRKLKPTPEDDVTIYWQPKRPG
jgi:hypothetical protein